VAPDTGLKYNEILFPHHEILSINDSP